MWCCILKEFSKIYVHSSHHVNIIVKVIYIDFLESPHCVDSSGESCQRKKMGYKLKWKYGSILEFWLWSKYRFVHINCLNTIEIWQEFVNYCLKWNSSFAWYFFDFYGNNQYFHFQIEIQNCLLTCVYQIVVDICQIDSICQNG